MHETVAVPLWLVVLAGVLAAVALLDRLLVPSVRWALRRRANRAIDRLNERLHLHIQPFKLTRRQVLIDRLLYDPEVLNAIEEYARETGAPREAAMAKARRYAREIVPSFSAYTYFRVGTRLARKLSRALYRVRLGYANDAALKAVDPSSSVVFVINHRSNMDYVLVTYVAAAASALSYAVGEWAQIWGLRGLISSMGAYFIRRNSRDLLYRRVLARYVHMATTAGVAQAVFPEGGLSRDGALRSPKFGLLGYMVSGFDPAGAKDIVFVPVGVNYDRVLEDRNLTGAAALEPGKEPTFRFNPMIFVRYIMRAAWQTMRGRRFRNGYACVSFGDPISLRWYLSHRGVDYRTLPSESRNGEVEVLGRYLMEAVARVIPALPVPLVATALLEADGAGLTPFELKGRVFDLLGELERAGAYVHIPRADRDYAIDVGLRMLKMRRLVLENAGLLSASPVETALLRYYANSIAHLVAAARTHTLIAEPAAVAAE